MKKCFSFAMIMRTVTLFFLTIYTGNTWCQPGNGNGMPGGPGSNFWNLQGNNLNSGQFLGSTNNASLTFKTNNLERISLLGNGDILFHNFVGNNNGLVGYNPNGTLYNIPFTGNGTMVLSDNGSFISNAAISGWSMNGNFLYNATHQVGIGVTAPSTSHILTVNGDALFTGEITTTGLKVLQRIEADTIKGAIRVDVNGNLMLGEDGGYDGITSKYEELRINSRPGYDHNVIINANTSGNLGLGISNPSEKLDLFGNARISGDIIFSGYATPGTQGNNFLVVDEFGRTDIVDFDEVGKEIYLKDCSQSTASPMWANISPANSPFNEGILYTGKTCGVRVGIGTDVPESKLDVKGGVRSASLMAGIPSSNFSTLNVFRQGGSGTTQISLARIGTFYSQTEKERFNFLSDGALKINHEGSENVIEIKNNNTKIFQLQSDGVLLSREVKVNLQNWPDYVFDNAYQLMPLEEVSDYIKVNKHLPGVPDEASVKEDGVMLGEMNKILLEKVEEMTLHLIDQNEMIKKQQEQIELLKQEVEEIKSQKK